MKLNDAIKTLDDVIPAPDNKMVDGDHKEIAIAWKEIREHLTNLASKPTGERLTQRNDRGLPYSRDASESRATAQAARTTTAHS